MNQELIKKVQDKNIEEVGKRPEVKVGDTVVVHTIIRDGGKTRIQKFEGMVIAIKGAGANKMFTVRKISYGVGVEKIFPLYSTNISKIEVKKHANVRRAKLYYMRGRIGKAAMKLKAGSAVIPVEAEAEVMDEVAEVTETPETPEAAEPETASTESEATETKAE